MTAFLDTHADAWIIRLNELVDTLDVPGAVFGVSHHGERLIISAGVAGLRNLARVTVDTAFQLGSISKLYTATLLLAVAGREVLERPVAELVPEAEWMGPEITVFQLLTHSSGLGGDWFADTGRGEDCLARYTAQLAAQPRDVPGPPGRGYSYCNSGYVVLGRLIEVLTGESYDAVLRTRLLDPLGAAATTTLPEDSILGPVAAGHNRYGNGPLTADAQWNFARAIGPAGGVCAPAGDVLTFAELHLAGGRTAGGAEILDPETTTLMRASHLETPPLTRPSARGLGFGIFRCHGGELVGHDGETLGQIAKLRLLPEHELAIVVLTNAIPDGDEIAAALEAAVLEPLGLTPPRLPHTTPDPEFDPRPYEGRYRNLNGTIVVSGVPGGLRLESTTEAEGLEPVSVVTVLLPLGDDAFVDAALAAPSRALRFGDPATDGRRQSLFTGRIAWRVATEADE